MKASRLLSLTALTATLTLAASTLAVAGETGRPGPQAKAAAPGAPGAGDPYFPLDGNGGYDVGHYDLDLRYDPDTDLLRGVATIRARATMKLSRFDLDFVDLTIRSVRVNGDPATWSRAGQELTITPQRRLKKDERFTVRVRYDGVPQRLEGAGFIATDDGFDIAGQPHVAATWFPVNDHPTDKASYTFHVTVPDGREVVANGKLVEPADRRGLDDVDLGRADPMASYLATVDVGEFDTHGVQDERDPLLRRHRPRPVRPRGDAADRHALRHLAAGGQLLQAAHAQDRRCRRAEPRSASRITATPSRTATSRSSRCTPSARTTGRPCRTSTATPPGHRLLVPRLAGPAPVHHRALPDRRPGCRDLHGGRGHG